MAEQEPVDSAADSSKPLPRAVKKQVATAASNNRSFYWKNIWPIYYDSYFNERLAEALVQRWKRFDTAANALVSLTASGSAVAGWALWGTASGKAVWAMIAGFAALVSVLHSSMRATTRLKEQEQVRQNFCALRLDADNFRTGLALGVSDETQKKFEQLTRRFATYRKDGSSDISETRRFRIKIQRQLNRTLGLPEKPVQTATAKSA
jgi:hypothetical protein